MHYRGAAAVLRSYALSMTICTSSASKSISGRSACAALIASRLEFLCKLFAPTARHADLDTHGRILLREAGQRVRSNQC